MTTELDLLAESACERDLMRLVRGGRLDPEAFAAAIPPFPLKLQIQTMSPCNAACGVCPWPQTKNELPQGTMREELFDRIVGEIAGRGVERVGLFLMNEPTLDRRLERLTAKLKASEPRATAVIYTNGALLDGERAVALAEAGMGEIHISVLGFDEESYRASMPGIEHACVMANLRAISTHLRSGRLGAMRVRIVTLDLPGAAEAAAAFRDEWGFEVHVKPVTNRAGMIDVESFGIERDAAPWAACQRPFVKAYLLYNGDAVLCNCDWRRTVVLGNVGSASLESIWRGARLHAIRKQHILGRLEAGSLCAQCDYPYLA